MNLLILNQFCHSILQNRYFNYENNSASRLISDQIIYLKYRIYYDFKDIENCP